MNTIYTNNLIGARYLLKYLYIHFEYIRNLALSTKINLEVKLNKLDLKVLNVLFNYINKYVRAFPSHETIAYDSGVHISTVKRIIAKFVSYGWLSQLHRNYLTNIYYANAFFYNADIRSNFSHIFSAFRGLSLVTLLAGSLINSSKGLSYVKTPYNTSSSQKWSTIVKDKYLFISLMSYCKKELDSAFQLWLRFSSRKQKRETSMEQTIEFIAQTHQARILSIIQAGNKPISRAIQLFKSQRLSKWGQIILSAYPDVVIEKVDMLRLSKFDDILAVCDRICTQLEITPDYNWVDFLQRHYKQPDDAVMVLDDNSLISDAIVLEELDFNDILTYKKQVNENTSSALKGSHFKNIVNRAIPKTGNAIINNNHELSFDEKKSNAAYYWKVIPEHARNELRNIYGSEWADKLDIVHGLIKDAK